MKPVPRVLLGLILGAGCVPAMAQAGGERTWPAASDGYLGLQIGSSGFQVPCGSVAFPCDDSATSAHLYAGTMVSRHVGVELGYVHMGRIERGGGRTRAHGLNASLVGRAPLARSLGVYGRLGATYGRTSTSVMGASGIAAGNEDGLGISYGLGLSWNFSPRASAIVGWDSHDFRFAGGDRDPVRSTSLGLQWRY